MTFVNVWKGNCKFYNTSCYRRSESIEAAKRFHQLEKEGNGSVQVLTFYAAQYRDLKNFDPSVRVCNVDSFQGQEADAVIVCLFVRDSKLSTFMMERGRVNVALSRAKCKLFLLGHKRTFERQPLWGSILSSMKTVCV